MYYIINSTLGNHQDFSVLPLGIVGFIVQYALKDGSGYHPKCTQNTGTVGVKQVKGGETGDFIKPGSLLNTL